MKQTKKYSQATAILTFDHDRQDQLYAELNRLGWFWDAKKQEWLRDETPAKEATKLVRVRVWAESAKIEQAAALFAESGETMGLELIEKSPPYPCRPPNQLESRIYLTFRILDEA